MAQAAAGAIAYETKRCPAPSRFPGDGRRNRLFAGSVAGGGRGGCLRRHPARKANGVDPRIYVVDVIAMAASSMVRGLQATPTGNSLIRVVQAPRSILVSNDLHLAERTPLRPGAASSLFLPDDTALIDRVIGTIGA